MKSTRAHSMQLIIIFLWLQAFISVHGTMTTERKCSAGFYWEYSSADCIECPVGHIGPNCSHKCPYPRYGRRCVDGTCNCTQNRCDAARGCIGGLSTVLNPVPFSHDVSSTESSRGISTLSSLIHHHGRRNMSAITDSKFGASIQELEITTPSIDPADFTSTVLITMSGTSICILLLVAIGLQVRSRILRDPGESSKENEYHEIQ